MTQMMVFSGAQRRRRWSAEEKLALVEAAFAPGAVVADVARAADLQSGQIYRWRQALTAGGRDCSLGFVEAKVSPPPQRPAGMMIVEFVHGVTVRIDGAATPGLVKAVLEVLSR